MKSAQHVGRRWSAFGFAVVALAFTLALAPRVSRAQTCAGDCDGSGDVGVNEIIILVNITLGSAENSACPDGIVPSTDPVDITMIIRAVNNALNNCPTS